MTSSVTDRDRGGSNRLELDDRIRLLMLGVVHLVVLVLVQSSIRGVEFGPSTPKDAALKPMTLGDTQVFVRMVLVILLLAFASSIWDWRHKLLSLLTWAVVYTVNRNNDRLVESARQNMAKSLSPVGDRQVLLLRALIGAMTAALVALVVQTGGWAESPYTQYAVTVFLLSMLLTDIFWGRVSLAIAGLMWMAAVIAWGRLEAYQYSVSSTTLAVLTVVNFAIQLVAVAMASETFEIGGLVKRRRESR